ncbi:hypothetical protein [Nocardia sp. BMG51109]|uniref:hypothetical protein n=1 Tax=Nocardia sp. BMG51109 TaxID=1056816 RepID=UPI0018DE1B0B|nr:hypothetical protein [Nocardia sp. BMG51109]
MNTTRWSTAAIPPPCGRGRNSGSSGSASSHNSSGTSRCDNAYARLKRLLADAELGKDSFTAEILKRQMFGRAKPTYSANESC